MVEKDCIYEINNELSDLNQDNILKPYGYQKLFERILDWHLKKIDLGMDVTTKYNLAWAFISISFEIAKPVEGIVKMYAQTWHSEHRRPYFRRDFVFRNEKGEIMLKGCSYSILLDLQKRTVYRKKELPFPEILSDERDFVIEASPKIVIDSNLENVGQRRVYNSYIDCLGHVNNIRYGEFAYDAFSDSERENLRNLKRMDVYFRSEMKVNDDFHIMKACEDGRIIIQGYNDTKSDVSFDMVFGF